MNHKRFIRFNNFLDRLSEIEIAGAAHLVRHQLSNKPKGAGTNPIEIDGTQLKMVLGALKKAEVVELIVLDDSLALLQDNTQFHLKRLD